MNFINEEIKCEGSPLCFLSSSIPAYDGEVEHQSKYAYINPSYMTTIVAGSAGSKEELSDGRAPSKTLAIYFKDYGLVFSHFDVGYSMHGRSDVTCIAEVMKKGIRYLKQEKKTRRYIDKGMFVTKLWESGHDFVFPCLHPHSESKL